MTIAKKLGFGLILSAAVLAPAGAANAADFLWSFTDGNSVTVASGVLTTADPVTVNIPNPQTAYAVLTASGSIAGVDGFTAENLSLFGTAQPPLGFATTPDGQQTYDDTVIGELPHVDGNGLEFVGDSGTLYNIFNNINTGNFAAGNYPAADVIWSTIGNSDLFVNSPMIGGTFDISAVPEPATWALFLLGFGAIGWTLRGARRQAAVAATA
jgi:hypothetical protein